MLDHEPGPVGVVRLTSDRETAPGRVDGPAVAAADAHQAKGESHGLASPRSIDKLCTDFKARMMPGKFYLLCRLGRHFSDESKH